MAARKVHYEAAFEDYLRSKAWPFVVVDEAKKAVFANTTIKSFDLVLYSEGGPNLLVDVKGRKFPDLTRPGNRSASRAWENWVTREDVEGLTQWEGIFGEGFSAAFVFAYWLQGPPQRSPFEDAYDFRDRHYAFVGVGLAEYVALARPRSQRWQTVAAPARAFSEAAKDIAALLGLRPMQY